jgi:hypothetical protein
MERMNPDPDMELVLAAVLDHILVTTDSGCFKRLRRKLLEFVRHEMDSEREFVDSSFLSTEVKNPDL